MSIVEQLSHRLRQPMMRRELSLDDYLERPAPLDFECSNGIPVV